MLSKPITPLLALLRACSAEERIELAKLCGHNSPNYLYQIATCERPSPSAAKALAIENASKLLHKKTGGRTPVVTMQELATMCALSANQH